MYKNTQTYCWLPCSDDDVDDNETMEHKNPLNIHKYNLML